MDLDFSEEQEMLREMVRGVSGEYASLDVVREMEDDPTGYPAELWKQLSELGVLGLLVPEKYTGSGQSMLEAAIVYEEFGRALVPSPHFASCVMSAGVLQLTGSEDQKQEWLPKIVSGEAILAPAWIEPESGFGARGVQLQAKLEGDEYRLSGTKRHVPFASSATRFVVLVRTGDGEEDGSLVRNNVKGWTQGG